MLIDDGFVPIEDGYIPCLPAQDNEPKYLHPLNQCCVTQAAARYLSLRYAVDPEKDILWVVEPCTVAASIACRDESLLRGGRDRHARSVWFAIGDRSGPKMPIGLVNFRPLESLKELRTDCDYKTIMRALLQWNLGVAEAFLVPPPLWRECEEYVPMADERYLLALTTALTPKESIGFPESNPRPELHKDLRPKLRTVPFASQWAISGVCAQSSMYMVALQLCLPDRGHVRVDGPFSISCFAQDVMNELEEKAKQQGQTSPITHETKDQVNARNEALRAHDQFCGDAGWRSDKPDQKFRIEGVIPEAISETLRLFLSDPKSQGLSGRPKMEPVHISTRRKEIMGKDLFRKIIESAVSSRLPVLVQIDAEIGRAAAVKVIDRNNTRLSECMEFLEQAHSVLKGKRPQELPINRPSEPHDPYHPLQQVHCVVVVGAKGLLGKDADAKVLFHDPCYGPYQEASFEDFWVAANLPFMKFVGPLADQNHYEAPLQGSPMLDIVIPVPHNIWFAPHELTRWYIGQQEGPGMTYSYSLMNKHILAPSPSIEWRVRLIHRDSIWPSYFGESDLENIKLSGLSSLLPSTRYSQHVLCIETYESRRQAKSRLPKTVFFGYVKPPEDKSDKNRVYEDAYLTPFTGGFGVERSANSKSGLVKFFRLAPDSEMINAKWVECDNIIARIAIPEPGG